MKLNDMNLTTARKTPVHSSLFKIKEKEKQAIHIIEGARQKAELLIAEVKEKIEKEKQAASEVSEDQMSMIVRSTKEKIEAIQKEARAVCAAEEKKIADISHNALDQASDLVIKLLLCKYKAL